MFKRLVTAVVVFVAVVVLFSPVTREMFTRRAIEHDVIDPLNANDVAALKNWPGSTESFLDMLHERCLRAHDRETTPCARYLPHG
jgi:hypothetical protein